MSGVQSVSESISISISITETESNSNANSNSGSTSQTQRNPFADPNGPFANLNLTAQQQQQIASIFSQAQQSSNGSSSSNGQSAWSQILSQINAILTPQQQQTLQSDLQTLKSSHHHHGEGSSQSNPLAELNLTSAQQTQIGQIVSAAQANGTSPADELNQIDNVLTPTQQQQLVSLFSSPDASSSTSTASGNVISTTA